MGTIIETVVLVFWQVCFGRSDGCLHGFSEVSVVDTRWPPRDLRCLTRSVESDGIVVTGLLKSFEIVSNWVGIHFSFGVC